MEMAGCPQPLRPYVLSTNFTRTYDDMKYLFFDCETSGLPQDYKAPASDTDNWPRLVSVAWLMSFDDVVYRVAHYVIHPIGFEIPKEATDVHGITTEFARKVGTGLYSVLKEFTRDAFETDAIVAHNLAFDRKILEAECVRANMQNVFDVTEKLHGGKVFCTMEMGTDLCKIPGRYGYKWPRLDELHRHLFCGDPVEGAHGSLADARACMRCFQAMIAKAESPSCPTGS